MYRSQSLEQSLTPPKTPTSEKELKSARPWSGSEDDVEESNPKKRRKTTAKQEVEVEVVGFDIEHQEVLLLHGKKQRYAHTKKYAVPELKGEREMLVKVDVIGLNPIDWKAPYVSHLDTVFFCWALWTGLMWNSDFGWGLPTLPCISGRDLAGRVVKAPKGDSRFRVGDIVCTQQLRSVGEELERLMRYRSCPSQQTIGIQEKQPTNNTR